MRALILPLVTSILFAGSFIAGKFTTADLGPLTTSLCRYLIALIFLSALIGHYKLSSLKVAYRDLGWLGLLGLSGIAGYHYFFFLSLRYTDVANTAIINASSPALTGFAASWLLGERLGWRNYLGIGLTIMGVMILLTRADLNRIVEWRFNGGDFLMLAAVLCWVVYALLLKSLVARYSSFTLTWYAVLGGVVVLGLLGFVEQPLAQVAAMSATSLYSIVYMGVFASGVGYLLYTYSVASLGPTRASGVVYGLVPVFVSVLAWMFFKEPITLPMVFSALLVLTGLRLILKQE
jgi:drug/metabolite transporter (DMT)-like permease